LEFIYKCKTKNCEGISNISVGCSFEWSILSFPDPFARRLGESLFLSPGGGIPEKGPMEAANVTVEACTTGSIGPYCAACKTRWFFSKQSLSCAQVKCCSVICFWWRSSQRFLVFFFFQCTTASFVKAFAFLIFLYVIRQLYNTGGVIESPRVRQFILISHFPRI